MKKLKRDEVKDENSGRLDDVTVVVKEPNNILRGIRSHVPIDFNLTLFLFFSVFKISFVIQQKKIIEKFQFLITFEA